MNNPFGFLIINKHAGLTSHDCVKVIRRIFNMKKVGHGGTLDPAVTGVLPIAIGNATRLLPYLPEEKTYKAIIQLGIETFTDDLEGEVISRKKWPILDTKILEKQLNKFRGSISQRPPNISSVHFQGIRAYKRARRGEVFNLPNRDITIYKLNLVSWDQDNGKLIITVHCSSGTYIRSLARDLGNNLKCGGSLAKLHRTQALGFKEQQSIPLKNIEEFSLKAKPELINPVEVLNHLPSKILSSQEELDRWRKGQSLTISENIEEIEARTTKKYSTISNSKKILTIIDQENQIAGIGDYSIPFTIKPKVVFNAYG